MSKKVARQFLLQKQLLLSPQALSGPRAVEHVFQSLRLIQYDPLNPCGRNTDLVLQSRIADYHPDGYFCWLYEERKGIECYDKELCIVPIEDFSLTHHTAVRHENRHAEQFLKKHATDLEKIIQQIDREGPISASQIEDERTYADYWSTQARWARVAIELLWKTGRIVIVKRERGKKFYDLPHKTYGEKYVTVTLGASVEKEHILRRIASVGLLPKSGTGSGWLGMGTGKELAPLINQLLRSRKLVEVLVEDIRQPYVVLASDVASLTRSDQDDVVERKRMIFLAPLDNVMWDRAMINNFFGFDYTWEVYVPAPKRKFGYYVLPIIYGDTFVGRIEPVLTREKDLEIKGFWPETKWNKTMWTAFAEALEKFKSYLNARNIINQPLPK